MGSSVGVGGGSKKLLNLPSQACSPEKKRGKHTPRVKNGLEEEVHIFRAIVNSNDGASFEHFIALRWRRKSEHIFEN